MDTPSMNTVDTTPSPAQAPGSSGDLVKDTTDASFQSDVIDQSGTVPVLVDFWAPWCGPCRQLGPALEKVVSEAGGRVKLVKINIDENQALASQMGVRSIPAVFAFAGGQPVDGFMGALPESELRSFVEKVLQAAPAGANGAQGDMNAQIEQALNAAKQAMESEETDQAINIYGLILQQMPEHADALIGLSHAFIKAGALEQARQTLELVPKDQRLSAPFLAAQKALALVTEAEELGDAEVFSARLTSNPNDHQARMDLSILLNASGNKQAAADALLEIIQRDREWNEDAGRTKLLEFFEAWGSTDPITISGRKKLSRLLFS